jgi:four helix bundle protein
VPSQFHQLIVYRRAAALAADVYTATRRWDWFDRRTLGIQLVRAADSVAANIAEASGRWHDPDARRLLLVARGSLYETEHWIVSGEQRGLLPEGTSRRIDEVARLLNGLIKRRREQ